MSGTNVFSSPNLLAQLVYGLGAPIDLESYNVSARRRLFNAVTSVSVPLSSSNTATASVTLPDTLTDKDGWLFDFLGGQVVASDTTGHLTIVDLNLSLFTSISVNALVPLGVPTPTTLIPRLATSLQFPPVGLITALDLAQWGMGTGAITSYAQLFQNQPQKLSLAVSMANNDGASAHSFGVNFWVGYRFVNGLQGA